MYDLNYVLRSGKARQQLLLEEAAQYASEGQPEQPNRVVAWLKGIIPAVIGWLRAGQRTAPSGEIRTLARQQ